MANLSLKSQNEIFKLLELNSVEPINKSFVEREIKQGFIFMELVNWVN